MGSMIGKLDANRCPHCGNRALSFFQKVRQGPTLPAKCRSCGADVVVPYWASLSAIPLILAVLGSFLLGSVGLFLLAVVVASAFMISGALASRTTDQTSKPRY